MESGIQSSFIPKDAGMPAAVRRLSTSGIADLALTLAIVAFAASCALAVAVFLYMQYLSTTRDSDLAALKHDEQQFQPELIAQLIRLDDRMHAAEGILNAHPAPSAFFNILNQVTAKTVSYSSLNLEVTDAHHITLKMAGVAQSINSIAFQADLLSKSGVFQSPIFSNLDHQKDGVHFNLTALVNPNAVNFVQLTGGQPAVGAAALPTATTTTSNSPFGSAPPSTQ